MNGQSVEIVSSFSRSVGAFREAGRFDVFVREAWRLDIFVREAGRFDVCWGSREV